MLRMRRNQNWLFSGSVTVLLLLAAISCGMSGNDGKSGIAKENSVSMRNENLAYNDRANALKDSKPARSERATFALG